MASIKYKGRDVELNSGQTRELEKYKKKFWRELGWNGVIAAASFAATLYGGLALQNSLERHNYVSQNLSHEYSRSHELKRILETTHNPIGVQSYDVEGKLKTRKIPSGSEDKVLNPIYVKLSDLKERDEKIHEEFGKLFSKIETQYKVDKKFIDSYVEAKGIKESNFRSEELTSLVLGSVGVVWGLSGLINAPFTYRRQRKEILEKIISEEENE